MTAFLDYNDVCGVCIYFMMEVLFEFAEKDLYTFCREDYGSRLRQNYAG